LRVALIVQTGSLPDGANSYVSISATRAFAAARKFTLPAADADVEALLVKAMDYVESYRAEFQGSKLSAAQVLQWPRTGVMVDGYPVGEDEVPACLPQAQARLACYAHVNGGALTAVGDGRAIIRERVEGAVDTSYSDTGDTNPQPSFPEADALLEPLLDAGTAGYGITVRV
jgi:hypothetical protein